MQQLDPTEGAIALSPSGDAVLVRVGDRVFGFGLDAGAMRDLASRLLACADRQDGNRPIAEKFAAGEVETEGSA